MKPSDLTELALLEVWRRVFEPPAAPDGIPDPGDEFEKCVAMVFERVEATVFGLPRTERDAFLLEKARVGVRWCLDRKLPDAVTRRGARWLRDLEKRDARPG